MKWAGRGIDRIRVLAEDGDPAAIKLVAEYDKETIEPPFWCIIYYQAYYDLIMPTGMGEPIIIWRDVSDYCRDIGAPEHAEQMFDVLRGIHSKVKEWRAKQ